MLLCCVCFKKFTCLFCRSCLDFVFFVWARAGEEIERHLKLFSLVCCYKKNFCSESEKIFTRCGRVDYVSREIFDERKSLVTKKWASADILKAYTQLWLFIWWHLVKEKWLVRLVPWPLLIVIHVIKIKVFHITRNFVFLCFEMNNFPDTRFPLNRHSNNFIIFICWSFIHHG